MTDLHTHADEIHEQFADQLDVTVEAVEERLDTLVNEYQVPISEARRSVTNSYLDEAGLDREDIGGGSGGNETVQAGPGDFFHIPAGTVHRDVNPDDDVHQEVLLTLIGEGPLVVNVDGPGE